MSANPIIYCLENLTDYRQFERLCSDLMSGLGYENIEPIGGTGDGGRDALLRCDKEDTTTIFAYTVRSDWKQKLRHDCNRIKEEGHELQKLVYVCTSTLNGSQRDSSILFVKEEFGWILEIYDLERIRVALVGNLKHILTEHPAIFCPPWFPTKGGISITESHDTIVLDHTHHDHAIASWLARKLSLSGYKTWCYGIAPMAGESINDSIKTLVEKRAIQYLPLISPESFSDIDFITRVGLALAREDFVIPCWSQAMDDSVGSSAILRIEPARFHQSLKDGLDSVLNGLSGRGIKPQLDPNQGTRIALQAFMPEPVTLDSPENIYANIFPVSVPKAVSIFETSEKLTDELLTEARQFWAFVKVNRQLFISFHEPPNSLPFEVEESSECSWMDFDRIRGKSTINVIKELIKRNLELACYQSGLLLCKDRNVLYFPPKDGDRHTVSYDHLDGRRTKVTMTGLITDGWGDHATKFRYQLGPNFKIGIDSESKFWATLKIYVRVTDLSGVPFKDKEIIRKRKKVTKSWWNKQWLARILGMIQGISNTEDQRSIIIGEGKNQVTISTQLISWESPVSIDVEAVDRIGDFQEEIADVRSHNKDSENDTED